MLWMHRLMYVMMVHAFDPCIGRRRQTSELEASLIYESSSRIARATQRNPVSKNQPNKTLNSIESLHHAMYLPILVYFIFLVFQDRVLMYNLGQLSTH